MKKAHADIARKQKQIGYSFIPGSCGIIFCAMSAVQIQKLKN